MREQIEALIETIKRHHINGNMTELSKSLDELTALAISSHDPLGLVAVNFYNGSLDFAHSNYNGAIDYMEKTLTLSRSENIPFYYMKAHNLLGIIWSQQADFQMSLTHYLEAYKITRQHPEYQFSSIIDNNIGSLFVWLDENELALTFLKRSYNLYFEEKVDDVPLLETLVMNICEACFFIEAFAQLKDWANQTVVEMNPASKYALICMEIGKNIILAARVNDIETIDKLVAEFIEKIERPLEYIFVFRSAMRILDIAIEYGLEKHAEHLLKFLENIKQDALISSFNYNFSTIKVKYYEKFIPNKCEIASHFLLDCCKDGEFVVKQLKKAYTSRLLAEIELDKTKNENLTVQERVESLQRYAELDSFTGLYNKTSSQKHIINAMRSKILPVIQALIVIDLDYFKNINDTCGHLVGDSVLKLVVNLIKPYSEQGHIVGRFGGDEFILFLDGLSDSNEITRIADEISQKAHEIPMPDKRLPTLSFSMGICEVKGTIDFDKLLSNADDALYKAKHAGRNQWVYYKDEQD